MTSVQMVIDAFYKYRYDNPYLIEIFDEAIKQEEQKIKNAYNQGHMDGFTFKNPDAERYYNENYKNL